MGTQSILLCGEKTEIHALALEPTWQSKKGQNILLLSLETLLFLKKMFVFGKTLRY